MISSFVEILSVGSVILANSSVLGTFVEKVATTWLIIYAGENKADKPSDRKECLDMYITSISPIYQKCLGMETEEGTDSLMTDENTYQKQTAHLFKMGSNKGTTVTEPIMIRWNDRGPPSIQNGVTGCKGFPQST